MLRLASRSTPPRACDKSVTRPGFRERRQGKKHEWKTPDPRRPHPHRAVPLEELYRPPDRRPAARLPHHRLPTNCRASASSRRGRAPRPVPLLPPPTGLSVPPQGEPDLRPRLLPGLYPAHPVRAPEPGTLRLRRLPRLPQVRPGQDTIPTGQGPRGLPREAGRLPRRHRPDPGGLRDQEACLTAGLAKGQAPYHPKNRQNDSLNCCFNSAARIFS